ncbi:MAG: ABC transporter ATP-binding protein [Oscillospiraceae bacterium]|nr:ABC transporter ATP-binding protein [Oscillospiraceae bacterium]
MNALEVKNICKSYKKTKRAQGFDLKNISLSLPSGCVMGLIGENGAGKSTLIKLICGIAHADNGEITVLGTDNKSKEFTLTKQDIGVVLDYPCFPNKFTANDINRIMRRTYTEWDENIFFKCLGTIDINLRYDRYSKGMKALLPIAIAMSHNAKLLIMDEPTSGLDPVVRDEILDMINDFTREENHSVLISSHILSDLEKICDYIAYISHGELKFCEEKDAMLDKLVIAKCGEDELNAIDSSKIIGVRKTGFGTEALVYRDAVANSIHCEKATIEDIMIYTAKSNQEGGTRI